LRHYDYQVGSIFHIFFFLIISLIAKNISAEPVFTDLNIKFEVIVEGLENPTGMTFMNNDILIIEKEGNLQLISNQSLEKNKFISFQ
jgi:glucose/arabinose dehydrogenase